jgi:hypothetical protein
LKADATVVRDGDRFHLKLVLRSGELVGERSIESDSCEALAGAAAVALVLLLNSPEPLGEQELGGSPTSNAGGSESIETPGSPAREATGQPVPAPPARPATDDDAETLARTDSTAGLQVLVQAPLVTLDFGPLPRPSGGVAAATGLRFDEWHFLIGVQVSLPQTVPAEDFPGYGAQVWRATAESWICRGWRSARLEVAPCLLLAVERITATGHGQYLRSSSSTAIWFSGGAGVLGRWYGLDSLALVVGAGGRIEASRPQIEIRGLGGVHQLGPAGVTVRIGSEWIW